jgi:hypothetical protein
MFVVALAMGCAHGGSTPDTPKVDKVAAKVAHQAAFDLQCEESALQVVQISNDMAGMMKTYGARGCGKQATYKAGCGMFGCTVVNEAQATMMGR